jgi:hypothetical protein
VPVKGSYGARSSVASLYMSFTGLFSVNVEDAPRAETGGCIREILMPVLHAGAPFML